MKPRSARTSVRSFSSVAAYIAAVPKRPTLTLRGDLKEMDTGSAGVGPDAMTDSMRDAVKLELASRK